MTELTREEMAAVDGGVIILGALAIAAGLAAGAAIAYEVIAD